RRKKVRAWAPKVFACSRNSGVIRRRPFTIGPPLESGILSPLPGLSAFAPCSHGLRRRLLSSATPWLVPPRRDSFLKADLRHSNRIIGTGDRLHVRRTSFPEQKILRVQQSPQDVLQFRATLFRAVEAGRKIAQLRRCRRTRERPPEKFFEDLLVGLAAGEEPADPVLLFRQQFVHGRPADHLEGLAHVAFARALGVGRQQPWRLAEEFKKLVPLVRAALAFAFRPHSGQLRRPQANWIAREFQRHARHLALA